MISTGGRGRLIAVVLAAVVVVALALGGCSVGPAESGGEFEAGHEGVLTVATDRLPQPGFWEGEGKVAEGGFEQGLAAALADRFGLARVELVIVPFADLVAGELGGADLGFAQITPTSEREDRLDFSAPYMSANPAALVRAGTEIGDVMAARDLAWAVEDGTTLAEQLEQRIAPLAEPLLLPDQSAVIAAVESGTAEAALLDLPVALAQARRSDGRLEVAAQLDSDEALAAALPPGSPNLEAVDSAIRALLADGSLDRLSREALGAPMRGTGFEVEDVPVLRSN